MVTVAMALRGGAPPSVATMANEYVTFASTSRTLEVFTTPEMGSTWKGIVMPPVGVLLVLLLLLLL